MDTAGADSPPPLSVKEIADKALSFEYNHLIPLRYWLRTADTILKQVSTLPFMKES